MKTLEQIKEEVAKELCNAPWGSIIPYDINEEILNKIAQRYADEFAKEALRLASNHVRPKEFRFYDDYERCEQSILSESNLPKHR